MEHNIKLSDKLVTVYLQSEKECKMADFYFTDFGGTDIQIDWIVESLKTNLHIFKTINHTEYLHLRAALVDIVAQFYY